MTTRNNAKRRESTWGYAKGVDGINTWAARSNAQGSPPSGDRSYGIGTNVIDESRFHDPDHFDLDRSNADQHLAFGRGLHYCLGASLGKLETRLALEELTTRFPDLRLVAGQRIPFHPNISFRGPQKLLARRDVSSANR